jgi:Skp family chaperone for outer membrane proteins
MKKNCLIATAAAMLATISGVSASAQKPATPQAAAPAAAATAAVPDSKIAYVNTEAFGDEKVGIARYVAALKSLEREFQPRNTELTTIQNQIKGIADELQKLQGAQGVVDTKTIQAKQDQGEKLQRDLKYKKEQADADFQRRYQEVVSPISEDIGKSLDVFAKSRGITMILDVSKLAPAILTATEGMDVTKAFIADYNTKNPGSAAAATPARP